MCVILLYDLKFVSPLKNSGWKMKFAFGMVPFWGTCQCSRGKPIFLGKSVDIHGFVPWIWIGSIPWQDLMPEAKRKFDMKFGMPRKTTLLEVQGSLIEWSFRKDHYCSRD